MKILYVAKHGPQDNEDEDAISFALRKLGHDVVCVPERQSIELIPKLIPTIDQYDFVLFHKWTRPRLIYNFSKVPMVAWDFDMVDNPDPYLASRCATRMAWYKEITPHLLVGFCTDGDWVARDTTGTLVHLMQGADERKVGYGTADRVLPPILFAGSTKHGTIRKQHVDELALRWGGAFIATGNSNDRVHGRELANMLASTKISISPDSPATHNYWSNRVYLVLGLGGFLIHSFCEKLTEHYGENELAYYHTRNDLNEKIEYYLTHDKEREVLRRAGHEKTLSHHLYRHRCEKLIDVVIDRLGNR